jgi:putative drug exporter of the RND superfamily
MFLKGLEPMARHRRLWLAGLGCCVVAGLIAQSFHIQGRLETAAHVEGSEAERVDQLLAQQFKSPFVHRAVLVIQGLPTADSEDGKKILRQIATAVRNEPGVSGTFSYLDWSDPIFLGRGGGTFILVGLSGTNELVDAAIPKLRERADGLRNQFRSRYPAVKFELTGETPLNFDLRKISAQDVRSAETRILPIVLLLLLVTFASMVAALLPLAVGMVAMLMTLGAAACLSRWLHLSILLQNIATMLGLGLGIDYALLMVSRFREALASGQSATEASGTAARHAGRTLLISASTVAIGFAALLMIPVSDVRSIGAAGFLAAGSCVLLANLILPPVLGFLGRRIDVGRPAIMRWANPDSFRAKERWRAWTRFVTARPWIALFLAVCPLLWLASQARELVPGLPRIDWLPEGAESVRALNSLDAMGRTYVVQSLLVILELPPGSEVSTYSGWNATRQLAARLASDKRADRVISLPSFLGRDLGPSFLPLVPADTRRNFLRGDGLATLLEILPAAEISTDEQSRWVRELRGTDAGKLTGVAGAKIRIGGIAAFNEDYDSVIRDGLPRVAALVLGGTLLALLLGFRAVAVAVKAIALNLLTVAAAFGALVLVFQDGHGSGLFGIPAGTGAVFSIVPIVAFAVVFGLSMDYEVFLVARVLEARRKGFSAIDAIVEGVANTGGLITSAAAIMIVVFAAFTFGNVLVIKMLGFTLAVAVLIDATLVRIVIGPALLRLGGDWNWWPWGLTGADVTAPGGPQRSLTAPNP